MLKKFEPPYLGAAYYPEDWDESEQEYDIEMMQKAGINIVRIAEFAWSKMEPKPGEYHFEWLHSVVDKLGKAGIAVILGTPTATPPIWLSKLYPDVLMINREGRTVHHGGRRHCCSNNLHYREYSAKIVEVMAKEFADDPYVVGWQIDNEIYGANCFCPECHARFAEYLREKYGTVENLNKLWNTNIFSQTFETFEDVIPPTNAWINPYYMMEWNIFGQQSHIKYVHMQAEILSKYVKAPIGTDTMPFNEMNYRRMTEKLDIVQFNHYNDMNDNPLCRVSLWFDFLRTLRPRPFWNTETQSSWTGAGDFAQSVKPDGFCIANSLLPIALGGEANMYWLWRPHWAAHETVYGGIIETCGKPTHIWNEVKKIGEILEKSSELINKTKVKTDVAFHFSSLNVNMLNWQPIVRGSNEQVYTLYNGFINCGVRPDVIDEEEPLEKYKIVFTSNMATLEEADLGKRMAEWVKNGGVWVVGPLTDIRTVTGTKYKHKQFGILEELTGVNWVYGVPDNISDKDGVISAEWKNGEKINSKYWYDLFEADENSLAKVTGGYSELIGKSFIQDCKVGKGRVIILGTYLEGEDLKKLYNYAFDIAGIKHGQTDGDVIVSEREGNGLEGVMLVEIGNKEGEYRFDGEMTNAVTGEKVKSCVKLKPYDVVVLKK